jgi:hypothetical protein
VPGSAPSTFHTVAHVACDRLLHVLAVFHLWEQNISTGRLTADILDAVFWRARQLLDGELEIR